MALVIFLLIVFSFVFLVGLCVGSFLNVVVSRAFTEESIVFPASKCPKCQKPLKWYHNIPVLSYLILKGKCAFCKDEISLQYPFVELFTGILFVLIFLKFGISLNALFITVFACIFVVMAATDIREKVVFDMHTYALAISGFIYNFFDIGHLYSGNRVFSLGSFDLVVNNSFIAALLGCILGILLMEAFARFGYLVAGTRAFGEGDTFIAAGLGAVFGWKYLLTVLLYAFIIQIVLTVPVFIKKLYTNKDYKTLISFLVFFLFIILTKFIENVNFVLFTFVTLLLCVSGIYLCKRILTGINEPSNMTYLPFGPAMVFGALIMIFM